MKIVIHSFVDLITNSSTEIYIMASEKTIETIKDIVNHLLAIGNSELKADDLFEFNLDYPYLEDYIRGYDNEEEAIQAIKNQDYYYAYIKVTAKDESNKETAKMLSRLHNLFDIEASYD